MGYYTHSKWKSLRIIYKKPKKNQDKDFWNMAFNMKYRDLENHYSSSILIYLKMTLKLDVDLWIAAEREREGGRARDRDFCHFLR